MSYYYFQYSDISSNIQEDTNLITCGAAFKQNDSEVASLSVAQCASFGISQWNTDFPDASFMILTTDITNTSNEPRLQYLKNLNMLSAPPLISSLAYDISKNINKQIFCSAETTISLLTNALPIELPEYYKNFPYDASYDSGTSFVGENGWFGSASVKYQTFDPTTGASYEVGSSCGNGFGWSIDTPIPPSPIEFIDKKFVVGCFNSGRDDSSGVAVVYSGLDSTNYSFKQEAILNPGDSNDTTFGNIGNSPVYSVAIEAYNQTTYPGKYVIALGQPYDISNVTLGEQGSCGSVSMYYKADNNTPWVRNNVLYASNTASGASGSTPLPPGSLGTDASAGDYFGLSLSFGGPHLLAVGAPGRNLNSGKCYIFREIDSGGGGSGWTGINSIFAQEPPVDTTATDATWQYSEFGRSLTQIRMGASNIKALIVGAPGFSNDPLTTPSPIDAYPYGAIVIYRSIDAGVNWSAVAQPGAPPPPGLGVWGVGVWPNPDGMTGDTSTGKKGFGYCVKIDAVNHSVGWTDGVAFIVNTPGSFSRLAGGGNVADAAAKIYLFKTFSTTNVYSVDASITYTRQGSGASISFVYPNILIGFGDGSTIVDIDGNRYPNQIYKYSVNSALDTLTLMDQLIPSNDAYLQKPNPNLLGLQVAVDPSYNILSTMGPGTYNFYPQYPASGYPSPSPGIVTLIEPSLNWIYSNGSCDISFANPILFDPETWTDNSNIPVTPSTYFQYSNKAGDCIDAITFNAPQIADFSNNYSLCAQYASRFLGTGGINAVGEEKERKYFVLYADDTDPSSQRITFLSDISGAYFDQNDLSGRQIFCDVQDTSAVTDAYWDGTDMSMASATPFYFDEDKWMKEAPSAPDTVMYYESSNILDYTICEFPVGTFSSKDSGQMAEYANKFLGQTLVDASGIPRECKYYVLYTNDLSDNRIVFKYNYDNTPPAYYFGAGNGSYAGIYQNGSLGYNEIYKYDFPDLQNAEFINMMITNLKGGYLNSVAFVIDYTDNTRTDISYAIFKSSINTLYDKSVGANTPSIYLTSMPSSKGQQVFVLDNIVEQAQTIINNTLTGTVTENNAILYNSTITSYNSIPCVANTQVFCSSANALNIWNNKTALEWDYMVNPPVSDPCDNDVLGVDVAVANNMVIGGAPGTSATNGSTIAGGRVLTWYTDNSGETWIEKTTIDNPVPQQGAYFGRSVALSYITSSTYLACIAANEAANDGMVYIYKTTNNGDTWSITQELKGSDFLSPSQNRFGYPRVALKAGNYSDNVLAVSAGFYNSVFVFSANTYDSSWNIIHSLYDPGPLGEVQSNNGEYITRFGLGLAIDGSFILVGAPGDYSSTTQEIYGGAAYLFKITALDSSLNLYQNLESFDISNGDTFGSSCSIDENLCVIGCTKNYNSDISGAAYVFKETNDTSWNQTAKLIDYLEPLWKGVGPDPNFGSRVSIKNNIIIVGANDDVFYTNGSISIFFSTDEGLSWPQIRNLLSLDPRSDKRFGSSVALSDNYAVVGEPMVFNNQAAFNRGAIYVIPKSLILDTTCNISKAPLRVFTNDANWVDNCNDVSMTYFQYSNYAGVTTKNIIITDSEIADFSNNYAKCAQYSSQFLGAAAFDASSEIVENKYFILYADDTNSGNIDGTRRISFIKDISGAHFDQADLSGRQIFCQLGDTSGVNNAIWTGIDNSMSYSTPLYFTEEEWLKTTPTPPDSNFYFQWSDISGYNIFDLPIEGAFDGSSVQQMANYGTSFLNKMLVDTEGVPRECKYFVLYTNDLSENRIQFKYDASGNNAGVFFSPKTQYYDGVNYNKQVFCSSANAIEIKEISNNNISGGFDCSFANEIKFFEDKWADNNKLVPPHTSYFRTSNIVAQYDGSVNPQVDIISYNAPQLTGIANNYGECAAYASKFFGTIGLTDPSGTGNWEEEERKYFVLITDDTDPSSARVQFKYDGSGAYYDPSCGAGGLATNCQIFCPSIDVVPLQEAPGPNYDPYLTAIGTNTMAGAHPRHFSG